MEAKLTCTIDGVVRTSRPCIACCNGCDGQHDDALCDRLPPCWANSMDGGIWVNDEEATNRARLNDAAPDLLASCKELVLLVGDGWNARRRAEAAIAKAEPKVAPNPAR